MADIDTTAAKTDKAEEARPAPGRADDPAILELCERINRVLRSEPEQLAVA